MKYIDHPEELAEASDPLNDDENVSFRSSSNRSA